MAKAAAAAAVGSRQKTLMERQVADALTMVDYAVSSGAKTKDGHSIPQDIIATIEKTAAKLGMLQNRRQALVLRLTPEEWSEFEFAYYDLSAALAPVTADTLRHTEGTDEKPSLWQRVWHANSAARGFSRKLFAISLGLVAFVIGSSWYLQVQASVGDVDSYAVSRIILGLLAPWTYGALGACVYLLRSAHIYIYQRTFDVRREPEYFNRILLGAIAGGAITLFVDKIAGDDGSVIQLSSAAIGFLTGYNTDLLFAAMERVSNALLPKIGLESVQRAAPSPTRPIDINDLAERHDKATGADKDLYKTLITNLAGVRSATTKTARSVPRRKRG